MLLVFRFVLFFVSFPHSSPVFQFVLFFVSFPHSYPIFQFFPHSYFFHVFSYFIGISFLFTLPLISALLCSFSTITSVRSRLIFPIFGRRIFGKNERGVSFILFLLLFLEKVRPEVAYRLHVPASQNFI